jgi:capsid assembly protease
MSLLLSHIAARLFNTPLMVDGGKAMAIAVALGGRVVGGNITFDGPLPVDHIAFENGRPSEHAGRLGYNQRLESRGLGDDILQMVGPVAVISIEGSLVHKGGWIGSMSGETSYQGIQAQVGRAINSPSVRGVVFEVDSFGGEVAGAFDTADMIAELSSAKPTVAILTDFALSAGYLMASAARQIVLPESGCAGGIGTIAMHADVSRALENSGVHITMISSGEFKEDGQQFKPLGADVLARFKTNLNAGRDLFADAVGRFRGRRLSKKAALETEAQVFRGEEAVEAGLVDGVIRPSQAFDAFVARVQRAA